jgi:hypothetical protein
MSLTHWLSERLGLSARPASRRKIRASRQTVRPMLEALEHRRTPSTLSFTAALGGGHAAVTLQIAIAIPSDPTAPEIVTVSRLLPNGAILAFPPSPVAPPQAFGEPIHDFVSPGPLRGWLEAAQISSSMFIPPSDGGGVT